MTNKKDSRYISSEAYKKSEEELAKAGLLRRDPKDNNLIGLTEEFRNVEHKVLDGMNEYLDDISYRISKNEISEVRSAELVDGVVNKLSTELPYLDKRIIKGVLGYTADTVLNMIIMSTRSKLHKEITNIPEELVASYSMMVASIADYSQTHESVVIKVNKALDDSRLVLDILKKSKSNSPHSSDYLPFVYAARQFQD